MHNNFWAAHINPGPALAALMQRINIGGDGLRSCTHYRHSHADPPVDRPAGALDNKQIATETTSRYTL